MKTIEKQFFVEKWKLEIQRSIGRIKFSRKESEYWF